MENRGPSVVPSPRLRSSEGPLPSGHGELPPWEVAELPAPPPFGLRNLIKVIGPGAIMAATSIGGGEWLVGPAAAVKYSSDIFLIATVAIALQVVFNLEAIRYTLYTGEPIYGGIMRLKPGPRFWAGLLLAARLLPARLARAGRQRGGDAARRLDGPHARRARPGRRRPGSPSALIVAVVLILSFGGTIERMLEYFAWTMLGVVFLFLIVVNVAFVPLAHWWQTFTGFFSFSGLPHPIDWGLIGALAATAGSGGIGNLTVTNWVRDKGFGMGSKVGAIPSAVGGHEIQLSHVGTVFPATGENLARWREWLRYVHADQIWVWGLFCFLGMFLNVNLATAIIPHGHRPAGPRRRRLPGRVPERDLAGLLVPDALQRLLDPVQDAARQHRHPGAHDHRRRLDVEPEGARASKRGIRAIYYGILIVFSIWGVIVIRVGVAVPALQDPREHGRHRAGDRGRADLPGEPALPAARRAPAALARGRAAAVLGLLRVLRVLRDPRPDPVAPVGGFSKNGSEGRASARPGRLKPAPPATLWVSEPSVSSRDDDPIRPLLALVDGRREVAGCGTSLQRSTAGAHRPARSRAC